MFPFISLFGKAIPTYGLCLVLAFFTVAVTTSVRAKKKKSVSYNVSLVVFSMLLAGLILGGTWLYAFVTYPFSYIVECLKDFDFSFLSGIVFYGGLIGGIIGAVIGGKLMRFNILDIEDIIVPVIPLAHAFGRIGCLFAGCCHGIEYNGPFAVRIMDYSSGRLSDTTYFPVQAVEAICDVFIMVYLLAYVRKKHKQGDVLCRYLMLYSVMRFCVEFLRGDTIRGIGIGISTSQWISIGILFGVVFYKAVSLKSVKT